MLAKYDQQIINALYQLNGNIHFDVVTKWLSDSLEELDSSTPFSKDEVQTRWNQGAQQVLRSFLERVDASSETMNKIRSR